MAFALAPFGRIAFGTSWRRRSATRPATPSQRVAAEAEDPGASRAVLLEMMTRESENAQGELEMLMLMADRSRRT
jgi:hypothetical protein